MKALFGKIRRDLAEVFHSLARKLESPIKEGHLIPDLVSIMILHPPKYMVSPVVSFFKRKIK